MSLETRDPTLTAPRPVIAQPLDGGDDLALFHRTLAELCRSEMPLPRALRLLRQDLESRPLKTATDAMIGDVERGLSLPDAYRKHAKCFPETYGALIEAGIASGDLPGVLDEVAHHAARRAEVADRVKRALLYPVITGVFVLVTGLGLLLFATPRLEQLEVLGLSLGLDYQLPGMTSLVMPTVALCALAAAVALVFASARLPRERGAGPRGLRHRIPVIARLCRDQTRASFTSTMALLLRRNVPLPQAMRLASAASDDPSARTQLHTMVQKAEEGASLADTMRAGRLVTPSLLWLLEASETSGSAVLALEDLARFYRRRLDRTVDRLVALSIPLMELVIGIAVLSFAIRYMTPAISTMRYILGL